MANTYSTAALNLDRNKVRLLIGDTNTAAGKYAFEDEEVDSILSMNGGDVFRSAGTACRTLATNEAKSAILITALNQTIDKKSISDRFLRLAQEFERRAENEPFSVFTPMTGDDEEFVDNLTARPTYDFEGASSE